MSGRLGPFLAALLFGAIGFGMGLLASLRLGQPDGGPSWTVAVAMSGFAAGTGSGIGRGKGTPFKLGIVGGLAGTGIGWILDIARGSWPLTAAVTALLIVGLTTVRHDVLS